MIVIEGCRVDGRAVVMLNGEEPDPRLDLCRSATSLEWGDLTSESAQLALVICAAVLQDDMRALCVYKDFHACVVANLPRDGFQLSSEIALVAIEGFEAKAVLRQMSIRIPKLHLIEIEDTQRDLYIDSLRNLWVSTTFMLPASGMAQVVCGRCLQQLGRLPCDRGFSRSGESWECPENIRCEGCTNVDLPIE